MRVGGALIILYGGKRVVVVLALAVGGSVKRVLRARLLLGGEQRAYIGFEDRVLGELAACGEHAQIFDDLGEHASRGDRVDQTTHHLLPVISLLHRPHSW